MKQDNGVSLRETGSRASTEPASGLGPSGFDPARDKAARDAYVTMFEKHLEPSFDRWWASERRWLGWRARFGRKAARGAYLTGASVGMRAMLIVQDQLAARERDGTPRRREAAEGEACQPGSKASPSTSSQSEGPTS